MNTTNTKQTVRHEVHFVPDILPMCILPPLLQPPCSECFPSKNYFSVFDPRACETSKKLLPSPRIRKAVGEDQVEALQPMKTWDAKISTTLVCDSVYNK